MATNCDELTSYVTDLFLYGKTAIRGTTLLDQVFPEGLPSD